MNQPSDREYAAFAVVCGVAALVLIWLAELVGCAVGCAMESDLTWREKRLEREIEDDVDAIDRFVDIGVILRTVAADPAGEELIPGSPKLRVLRSREFGGILDTRAEPPHITGPSPKPRVWYCSEEQEAIILHSDELPLGQLVYGSEGAGKSTAIAMWLYFRWLEHLGDWPPREGGLTAPTKRRLKMVRKEIFKLYGEDWFEYLKSEQLFVFCDGTWLQLVSTHRQSEKSGSPLQGANWTWCARDEQQDQLEVADDIEARGRAAPNGRYKQIASATAKDSADWRTFRDKILTSGMWLRRTLLGTRSPFVHPSHWERCRRTMSPREYERRVLAMDVPVELAVYYGWDRRRNLTPLPRIVTDVTAAVLAQYQSYVRRGVRFTLLAGHDPGNIFNTTVLLKLLMFGGLPVWTVVGELQTKQTTAGQHAAALRQYLQQAFELERADTSKCAIFCDPHGKGEAQTDYQTVYMAFQREGLDVFSPAPMSGKIKRTARVAMTNRLLYAANHDVRLVVAQDAARNPLGPRLVEAFESLEKRPGDDDPEGTRRKDEDDKTHAPAALAYALWPFEQEAISDLTIERAVAEARRVRM